MDDGSKHFFSHMGMYVPFGMTGHKKLISLSPPYLPGSFTDPLLIMIAESFGKKSLNWLSVFWGVVVDLQLSLRYAGVTLLCLYML
jgi:hypothetical protein